MEQWEILTADAPFPEIILDYWFDRHKEQLFCHRSLSYITRPVVHELSGTAGIYRCESAITSIQQACDEPDFLDVDTRNSLRCRAARRLDHRRTHRFCKRSVERPRSSVECADRHGDAGRLGISFSNLCDRAYVRMVRYAGGYGYSAKHRRVNLVGIFRRGALKTSQGGFVGAGEKRSSPRVYVHAPGKLAQAN